MTSPETWLAARIAAGRPAETWKPVPGWPHEVSDQGRIRTAKGRVLTQRAHNRPREVPPERRYRKADLCSGADKVTVLVHQVVLQAFAGERPAGHESRHLDDNPVHNWWPENLAWGTPDQNAADKARQPRYHTPAAQARRSEQAQRGRATQLAERDARRRADTPSPQPKPGWWRRVTRYFPWSGRG
jgi:hypothetical protein